MMNEFERKLLEYRDRERRNERLDRWKLVLRRSVSLFTKFFNADRSNTTKPEKISQLPNLPTIEEKSSSEWETDSASVTNSDSDVEDIDDCSIPPINWHKLILHVIVWGGMFAYAVHVEFGTVYFLLSGFYFMWINTRTDPRKPYEVSAYSVFNPYCERIQGTLDAETLEKEMKYGFIV